MRDTKAEILKFWFEETQPAQWFQSSADFDEDIRTRFLSDYDMALNGIYDAWLNDAQGALALIIMLDQFPRNMFRGTARMYEADAKALDCARQAVAKGFDQLLTPQQRGFVYLPFEHSEDLTDQHTSVALFESMKDDQPVMYDYAIKHLEVIEEFGRFPHRNKLLGRVNTKAEEAYLARPDSGF